MLSVRVFLESLVLTIGLNMPRVVVYNVVEVSQVETEEEALQIMQGCPLDRDKIEMSVGGVVTTVLVRHGDPHTLDFTEMPYEWVN